MTDTQSEYKSLDHRTDAILDSFDDSFAAMLSRAQARVITRLRGAITLDPDGDVTLSAANVRVVQSLPTIFKQAMQAEGYDRLLTNFAGKFDGGMDIIETILNRITDGYKIRPVIFTAADRDYFTSVKKGTVINLLSTVDQVSETARRNVMFTVGGRPFEKTAVTIAERLHVAAGEASTLAATGISTFYRTITDKGFETIEDALSTSGKTLEYTYYGPDDKFTRPFCERLMKQAQAGRTWSRRQIEAMDNGQLPDVFRSCGGWNCRHSWIVAPLK